MQSNTLMNLITGILEDSMKLLKKIEKNIDTQNRSLKQLSDKLKIIKDKVDKNFNDLLENHFRPVFNKIIMRLELIDKDSIKEIDQEIENISNTLQNNFQIQTISLLNKMINLQLTRPRVSTERITSKLQIKSPMRVVSLGRASTVETSSVEEQEEIPEGDWTESELEGAEIFEKIITGWKRRDFEKSQGTKEIFMKAWKKLSSYDRAQIKTGAWSQNLINKIKMLGRN
ncbi:MAG: hypothetical protein ACTSPY_10210 [Candidatus Helarchaeota archaeon]